MNQDSHSRCLNLLTQMSNPQSRVFQILNCPCQRVSKIRFPNRALALLEFHSNPQASKFGTPQSISQSRFKKMLDLCNRKNGIPLVEGAIERSSSFEVGHLFGEIKPRVSVTPSFELPHISRRRPSSQNLDGSLAGSLSLTSITDSFHPSKVFP